jgi:3-hydroxyacyl-CoA dehydrogenase/enoyl-CoA hydratase/3-hydroxybutyryl-CoA epimerase/enoyl-CoA isomerase
LDELKDLDLVVEAVVENESVKKSVLKETESILPEDAILTSNTSSISITRLAKELKRPENFCGMHFFNPVHRMPLVETIRGEKTGEAAVASTVAYALALGKTPIVVNDCPGFLVNRVLFAYLGGFIKLLQQGVSFTRIDKIMEKFGWPMGPAYLLDVVGIDTSFHASAVMREGFPERMTFGENTAIQVLFEAKRFGQKNGQGFYQYTVDKKGRPQKMIDPNVDALLAQGVVERIEVSDDEIVERMMLPMLMESSRCLQEKIVDTPTEVDLGLVYGLGFPPYRGGIFAWADQVGISNIVQWSEKYLSLGAAYLPSEQLINMKASQTKFYPLK